jgi:hypothetical protein
MGTPFELITKTNVVITELTVDPKTREVTRSDFLIPDTILPVEVKFRKRSYTNAKLGRSLHLPRLHYFGALLLKNEVLACQQRAADSEGLLRAFRKEYPEIPAKQSRMYQTRFPNYRSNYNKGRLYNQQQMPPLYSFAYTKNGYIRHSRVHTELLNFEFCKRVLTQAKFADPRFFTPEEIIHYREVEGWHVPFEHEIQKLEAEIQKPLYNSIEFPPGYGKDIKRL